MIDLSLFPGLTTLELGPWEDKPTSFEGNQQERSRALWTSPDGRVEIGVWECTPGRFRTLRDASSEFCHFLAGNIEITRTDGTTSRLGPGDAFNLPLGWKGEWTLHSLTRKIYVVTKG